MFDSWNNIIHRLWMNVILISQVRNVFIGSVVSMYLH
jgi:hypothetical protein